MKVIIVGGGKVGSYLASLLLNGQHQVKVIEMRPDQLPTLQHDLPEGVVVLGNGTDPRVLESVGIRQAHVVAAVTGADETNLVVATVARFEFGVQRVIARVNNPKNAWMFTPDMGVDVGLNQADLIARLVAEEMSLGDIMILLKLRRGQYSLVEEKVHPASSAVGKAVRDLHLPVECILVAVIRHAELLLPRGSTILLAGDEVLAIVHASQLEQLATILGRAE
ncbi:MAG: potassium transporter TrkA [Chloroflexi bacterium RBG_13_56_8]|nr:MAG: potassium transporter TrkA [Chloroflexi bacterium RBG_13_56_8]